MSDQQSTTSKSLWFRSDKRLYILLICFVISTIFWLLLALSNDYTTTITLPVSYTNFPGEKIVLNELPQRFTVNLKTNGFKILSFGIGKNYKPVEIDVKEKFENSSLKGDLIALPTSMFLRDFSSRLGNDITVVSFAPDSIVFNFSDIATKRVPVEFSYRAEFDTQFDSTGNAFINPAYIDVSGPPEQVEKLKQVNTEFILLSNLKGPVKRKVKLVPNQLLKYSQNEVVFNLPVEKFTEGTVEVDIHSINVRPGYSLKTFPDKVKIRYQVSISNYNKVEPSMFDAVVEGGEMENKRGIKLDVAISTSPDFVKVVRLEPEKVDFILRKR